MHVDLTSFNYSARFILINFSVVLESVERNSEWLARHFTKNYLQIKNTKDCGSMIHWNYIVFKFEYIWSIRYIRMLVQ